MLRRCSAGSWVTDGRRPRGRRLVRAARGNAVTITESQAPLAQLAEQRTLNPRVRGSSPWRRTCENLPRQHTAVERVVEQTAPAALRWPHAAPRDRSHRATAERLL